MVEEEKFDICKCGFNPALNENEFTILFSEYGIMDKVLIQYADATCKKCGEKFKFEKDLRI